MRPPASRSSIFWGSLDASEASDGTTFVRLLSRRQLSVACLAHYVEPPIAHVSRRANVRCKAYGPEVARLEDITYEAGRQALADQEALVAGIRQRTGTLLAAHALVASFLGATTIRDQGLEFLGWMALIALVLGLVVAAVLLAPWRLKFAVDAQDLYTELYPQAEAEAESDALGWLAAAGYGYQSLRQENAQKVRQMSWLSGSVGILMIAQKVAWLAALAVE
jgi:hypothetical protein